MGQAKQILQKQDERRGVATQIAIESGVLKKCPYHETILDAMSGDSTPAYKLGNRIFSEGEISDLFKSPKQLTDEIDEAVSEAEAECSQCSKA